MLRQTLLAVSLGSMLVLVACGPGADYQATCTADTECFEGYACVADEPGSDVNVCLHVCGPDVDCLQSQYCDIPSGEPTGVCRFGSAP